MPEVLATLEIRRNSDGLVRTYPEPWAFDPADEDGVASFIWSEGNYACDCNRHIFFCRSTEEDDERECGDGAYSVRLRAPDGAVVYEDGDWDA